VFELNLFAIGMGMYFQWIYATGNYRLVEPGLDPNFIRHIGIRTLVVPAVSLVAILVALTGNLHSAMLYMLIPFVHYGITRRERTRGEV
ncbi:MAG: DUF1211 domain-containing protein, partial [Methanoregula sp.]|nr:DUF1211 domain-containing protein [Methanoregula sp.]